MTRMAYRHSSSVADALLSAVLLRLRLRLGLSYAVKGALN